MGGGFIQALGDVLSLLSGKPSADDAPDGFWESVKLIHADDLRRLTRFPHYREHDSTTYLQYRSEAQRLDRLRREIREILQTLEKLEELDHDGLERYQPVDLPVGRSVFRRPVRIPLPPPQHPETVFDAIGGTVSEGEVIIERGWRRKDVYLRLSCPSRVLHAEEIATKRAWLEDRHPEEKEKLHEVRTSRFTHPVLFISHRWESTDHPDPEGKQLAKLSALRDCFVIYDYSSFPQDVTTEEERAAQQLVLRNMGRLIERVAVLKSADYIDRGWCLYEYMIASFKGSLVCDEIRNPEFLQLRQWSAMRGPAATSLKGHSFESGVQNFINESILETVNGLLPHYRRSGFTVAKDRELVTNLLLDELMARLPAKKEYPSPYLGEWVTTPWKREELEKAFTEPLEWPRQQTTPVKPQEFPVPSTIEAAVAQRYAIEKPPPMDTLTAMGAAFSAMWGKRKSRAERDLERP